jgi:hypothetical protein
MVKNGRIGQKQKFLGEFQGPEEEENQNLWNFKQRE